MKHTKRFTDANKWEDAWYLDLPLKYKMFWLFLLDRCDNAGIWEVNFKLAEFFIGEKFEPTEIMRIMGDRIRTLREGKYWFYRLPIKNNQRETGQRDDEPHEDKASFLI